MKFKYKLVNHGESIQEGESSDVRLLKGAIIRDGPRFFRFVEFEGGVAKFVCAPIIRLEEMK